jgi:hypothetical protein
LSRIGLATSSLIFIMVPLQASGAADVEEKWIVGIKFAHAMRME